MEANVTKSFLVLTSCNAWLSYHLVRRVPISGDTERGASDRALPRVAWFAH